MLFQPSKSIHDRLGDDHQGRQKEERKRDVPRRLAPGYNGFRFEVFEALDVSLQTQRKASVTKENAASLSSFSGSVWRSPSTFC
jgi:hypothetical protein